MRPFFRNAIAICSFGLSIATVALWSASYRFPPSRAGGDVINFSKTDPLWWVLSARGHVTLCRQDGRDWGNEFPGFEFAGFKWGGLRGPKGSLYNLAIPHWSLAAVLAAYPVVRLRSIGRDRRRRRAVDRHLCPNCGYDLRAAPERCPECGAEKTAGKPVR